MAPVKDRRITAKAKAKAQSAQSHGYDMVNGTTVGHSLPFVDEREERYLNLFTTNPASQESINPDNNDGPAPTGSSVSTPAPDTGSGLAGRPGYVAPAPAPAPTPAPDTGSALPGRPGSSVPATPSDTGGGTTTLPVTTPVDTTGISTSTLSPSDGGGGSMTPPSSTPVTSAPPTVISTPATASPEPPVANAGPSQSITGATGTLDASGSSDPQDSQLTFSWLLISGPNMPVINNPAGAATAVSGMVAGSYIFKLTVTNALGLNSTSTTSITVTSADNSGATLNTGVTTLNSGSTVLTTAPLGDSGLSPYGGIGAGGGGGGGGGSSDAAAPAPESMWQKIWDFTKDHWLLLALLAAGTGYVLFKKDGKQDL